MGFWFFFWGGGFFNFHSFSNTTILHEENNSLNLKVLALLQE
jgi:hypothetical protein